MRYIADIRSRPKYESETLGGGCAVPPQYYAQCVANAERNARARARAPNNRRGAGQRANGNSCYTTADTAGCLARQRRR